MSMSLYSPKTALWVLIIVLSSFDVVLAQPQFRLEIFSALPSDQFFITKNIPEWERYRSHTVLLSLKESALLALHEQKPETFTTTLPLPDGARITIAVKRRNPFSADAQRTTSSLQQSQAIEPQLMPILYTGTVVGESESMVSLCCTSDELFGIVTLDGRTYNIGKVRMNAADMQTMYALSDEHAASSREYISQCAVTEQEIMQQSTEILSTLREISDPKNAARLQSERRLRIEVAVEVDFAMYQQFNSNVERASAYATSLIATVSQIFERDLNVELSISYLNVWTSQDPFTGNSTSAVLNSLTTFWQANRREIKRSLVHLISTRAFQDAGGRAFINALCANGYGVSGSLRNLSSVTAISVYSREVSVVAHELGHNFGSPHTHSCLWPRGAIDSCARAEEGSCFFTTRQTLGTIMSYCNPANGGLELRFHPSCSRLMRAMAEKATCVGNEQLSANFSVSGTLRYDNNIPASNILLTLPIVRSGNTRATIDSVFTDMNGNFRFTRLPTGQVNIFAPTQFVFADTKNSNMLSIIVAGDNVTRNALILRRFSVLIPNRINTISHRYQIIGDAIKGGVTYLGLRDSTTFSIPNGKYSIIPTAPGHTFDPLTYRVTINNGNVSVPAFTAAPNPMTNSITGRVYNERGAGIANITVFVQGVVSRQVLTDSNGAYIVNGLPLGRYEVSLNRMGQTSFTSYSFNFSGNSDDAVGIDFLATQNNIGVTSVGNQKETMQVFTFPNPITDAASIHYTLSTPADVRLELYSALGMRLMTLIEERQGAGNYVVPVDVRHLPSGQYYYRLRVGVEQTIRSLQVVR